jgi:hypothetical protein
MLGTDLNHDISFASCGNIGSMKATCEVTPSASNRQAE